MLDKSTKASAGQVFHTVEGTSWHRTSHRVTVSSRLAHFCVQYDMAQILQERTVHSLQIRPVLSRADEGGPQKTRAPEDPL